MSTTRREVPEPGQPLYVEVAQRIAHEIVRRDLRPGDRLPPERTLCRELGVSRLTLRRALLALADEGAVESDAGRGWFVGGGLLSEPPNALLSFTRMAASRGLTSSARVLTARVRPATIDEAEALHLAPGADVFELERLRLLDGIPVAVDRSRVPLQRAPSLPEHDWTRESLYRVLEEVGVVPVRASYSVEAVAADARHAELLGLPVGAPLLLAQQVTFDQDQRPFELGRMAYRGDRYRFRATLTRPIGIWGIGPWGGARRAGRGARRARRDQGRTG